MKAGIEKISTRLEKIEEEQKKQIDIQTVQDLEQWFSEKQVVYNSEEETQRRDALTKELMEIGRKRREAFFRGESMSLYPLPWERKDLNDKEQ